MIDKEQRTQLRMAVQDGAQLVALLRAERLLDDGGELQLIGDGLVAALADKVEGAAEAAAGCAEKLRERGWLGDDELADQLEARLGTRPTPMLRPLLIDLEELAMVLEGDQTSGGGRIDLRTGEVFTDYSFEYAVEIGEEPDDEEQDPDRWLHVWCEGSRAAYGDMEDFIDTRTDPDWADSSASRSRAAALSGGSRTSFLVRLTNSRSGTPSPTSASAAGPGSGSRAKAIAWRRSADVVSRSSPLARGPRTTAS